MWRYSLPAIILLASGAVLLRGLLIGPGEIESPLIGKPAPIFELPSLLESDTTVRTDDFLGSPFLLNAWAVWCEYCAYEHPFLMELAQSGIPIVGFNWKEKKDPVEYLRSNGNPFVVVAEDADGRAGIDWGIYGAPETFLIGADGTVLQKHTGPLTPEIWREKFHPLF
jgi:cytochrome c biogenesis protein CcmG/thiol:disulfide interchange protein DsbE